MIINLEEQEWQQVLSIVGGSTGFPWTMTNPLLMKIGAQMQIARGGVHAAKGVREQSNTRADPSRLPPEIAPPNSGYSAEQREERQGEG